MIVKAIRTGNTIVAFIKNKMYQRTFSSQEEVLDVYDKLLNVSEDSDLNELIALFETKEMKQYSLEFEARKKEAEAQKGLLEWMQEIRDNGDEDFMVKGVKLYMKGINITIPEFLAKEIASRRGDDSDYEAIKNFWRLLALNPDPRCREDLFRFLVNHDMTITPSGYFVAYRNAKVRHEGERELNEFIATSWAKIKRWKKAPSNYVIYAELDDIGRTGEYEMKKSGDMSSFEEYETIGIVSELYDNLSTSEGKTVYTDAYSGSTEIIMGQPVSVDRRQCDANPDHECSRGLHVARSTWLSQGYFGGVGIAVLVNPLHVLAVPYADAGKMRVCEYLPICEIEYDEGGRVIPFDTATFEHEYSEHTIEQIEEMIENTNFESLKEHEIIPKEISKESLRVILHETKEHLDSIVKSRVVKIS